MDKETGLPEGASTYSAGTSTDPWTEVRIEVPAERIDAAGDIAHMTVPYGIYLEDYRFLEEEIDEIAHIDLIDEALKDKDRSKGVVHIYLEPGENPAEAVAFLQEQYAAAGIPTELTVVPCRNEDWQDNWKQFFKPTEVGQKLLIQPIWEVEGSTRVEPTSERKTLYLEPGLAFGTGTHETTRLCLQTLEETIRGGETVLDLGCGSGILSIAALLFGASRAEGVD
ncbi:MAG: 50S ribosomal protein L11 methyltransferase, partial [Clostridia bacterium]|nr:50S ribosomal protein L11 methyltransferase [Clostridia bacterium]